MSQVTIKSVNYKEKTGIVAIKYEELHDGKENADEHILTSHEPPRPELIEACKALAVSVGEIVELGAEWAKTVTVYGAIFSWKNGIMGARINSVKKLECGYLWPVLTPYKASENANIEADQGEAENTRLLSDSQIDALEALMIEAKHYIDGNRAQNVLPLQAVA